MKQIIIVKVLGQETNVINMQTNYFCKGLLTVSFLYLHVRHNLSGKDALQMDES